VKANPALLPGVLGAWISHWKALEQITFDEVANSTTTNFKKFFLNEKN
jgi:hypothetical protein